MNKHLLIINFILFAQNAYTIEKEDLKKVTLLLNDALNPNDFGFARDRKKAFEIVQGIDDKETLKTALNESLKTSKYGFVRAYDVACEIFKKIKDPVILEETLYKIFEAHNGEGCNTDDLCAEIIKEINDQNVLEKALNVAFQSKRKEFFIRYENTAAEIVKKITSKKLLERIFLESLEPNACKMVWSSSTALAALKRIDDQNILAQGLFKALEERDSGYARSRRIACEIIPKITDKNILKKVLEIALKKASPKPSYKKIGNMWARCDEAAWVIVKKVQEEDFVKYAFQLAVQEEEDKKSIRSAALVDMILDLKKNEEYVIKDEDVMNFYHQNQTYMLRRCIEDAQSRKNLISQIIKEKENIKRKIIDYLNQERTDYQISYKVVENFINSITMYKNSEDAEKLIIDLIKTKRSYLIENHQFLCDEDCSKILENLISDQDFIEHLIKNDWNIKDICIEPIISNYIFDTISKIYNQYKQDIKDPAIEYYKQNLSKLFIDDHLFFLFSPQQERKENWENYRKNLDYFLNKIKKLNLNLKEKITASLYALSKESDGFLRGFYSDIFESNTEENDIKMVVIALNNIEGCEDCARVFSHNLVSLNKKNEEKEIFEIGSFEYLRNKIHLALYQKRIEIFNQCMKERNFYPLKTEEQVYGYAKIQRYYAKLFSIYTPECKETSYRKKSGELYIPEKTLERNLFVNFVYPQYYDKKYNEKNENSKKLIYDFFELYNKKEIFNVVNTIILSDHVLKKTAKRFVGMNEYLQNENIIPEIKEEEEEYLALSTIFIDRKYDLKRPFTEDLMVLLGFSKKFVFE